MKKLLVTGLILFLVLYTIDATQAEPEEIKVNCQGGVILIETKTSRILFEQDADKRWPPASITKIMTAIVALENGDFSKEVEFTNNAVSQIPTNLDVDKGVKVPLYKLIEAMLVRSGNDSSVAIAEHIGGTEREFVRMMNDKARELGMNDTNFENPSGLPNANQYSTARDLAILVTYAMNREDVRQIVSQKECQFITSDGKDYRTLYSTNRLLGNHPLVNGVKTGYTNLSRFCLAASASFRNYDLIAIVLGAEREEIWNEAARLLDYGFEMQDPLYPLYRKFDPVSLAD